MHVLFIGFVWPEPKSSAAGQNILSYIETAREQDWQVSFCSAAQVTEQTHDLASMGVHIFPVALNCNSFNQQITDLQADVVIFDRYLSFEQFAWRVKKCLPEALLVLDAEDLHCLRLARHSLVNEIAKAGNTGGEFMKSETLLQPEHIHLLHNETALREVACILQADITLVLSNFEFELLRDYFHVPSRQLAHIAFIFDVKPAFTDRPLTDFEGKHDFIFIGNFRHAPNYHSVTTLAQQCWPTIYRELKLQYPDIACHVYGAYMSPKAKQLENKQTRFFVHGFANDQFSVIQQARVMLAPISFGAGVKGKLLDAMRCATPSVTSPLGYEGITHLAWHGLVANTINEFIDGAVRLYRDKDAWNESNNNAVAILHEQYQSARNKSKLVSIIEHTHRNLAQHRQANFMQSMLSHHQFQTSKYMSQWIEAKNANK